MDSIVHGVAKSWTRLSNFHLMARGLTQKCSPHSKDRKRMEIHKASLKRSDTPSLPPFFTDEIKSYDQIHSQVRGKYTPPL